MNRTWVGRGFGKVSIISEAQKDGIDTKFPWCQQLEGQITFDAMLGIVKTALSPIITAITAPDRGENPPPRDPFNYCQGVERCLFGATNRYL